MSRLDDLAASARRRIREALEDAFDYPGASSPQVEYHADALAGILLRVVTRLNGFAPLREGYCVKCGESVDGFNGAELRLVWVTARITQPDGKKAGGRNNPGRTEERLNVWMCRRCSDEHQAGIHRDQRALI
jgi:hypothetical protein